TPLADHGVHFIAQPHVQSEVVADVPVILDISPGESRPVAPWESWRKPCLEGPGVIEKEALDGRCTRVVRIRQGGETQQSVGEITWFHSTATMLRLTPLRTDVVLKPSGVVKGELS